MTSLSLSQSFEAHSSPGYNVGHMVRWGGGVWMAFSHGSSIHLFHTESLELLQEVNIGPHTAHLAAGNGPLLDLGGVRGCSSPPADDGPVLPGPLRVSSLLVSQGLLWVGTSQGAITCFPVPTLEGIPNISGGIIMGCTALTFTQTGVRPSQCTGSGSERGGLWVIVVPRTHLCTPVHPPGKGMTSLNAHCGPVDFLVAARHTLTSDLLRQDSAPTTDEDQQQHRGRKVPGRQVLRYRLRSTCQLPGGPLGSQAHPEPPGHGPEDGAIYAVSGDPGVWLRGGATQWGGEGEGEGRRSSVLSTAVFSGGRGHRRLGGPSAGGAESLENTVLLWQLPLRASQ